MRRLSLDNAENLAIKMRTQIRLSLHKSVKESLSETVVEGKRTF